MLTLAPLALCLAPALVVAPAQATERPDAETLVAQAWLFLPAYDGEHRAFLSDELRTNTAVGAHLLEAAVELEPEHLRGLWSLGHARILLAEDARNRDLGDVARAHYVGAVSALSRSIDLFPTDPWACYARGAAHTAFGADNAALRDLDAAIENADALIANGDNSISWLRFKALEWRAEVLMRLGEHERARAALRAFHSEFSNNNWPLYIALAESYERERDFAGARASYDDIVAEFPTDHQAYGLLGYLEGLVDDRERATSRLLEAIENELEPDMYLRMWLFLLATDDALASAESDLRLFLENPPDSLSDWDRGLGLFTLGEGTPAEFLERARAEVERRIAADEALDDLMCEASFYAGWREERGGNPRAALDAYRAALAFHPPKWKWEWAFARLAFARLAAELELAAAPPFTIDGDELAWDGETARIEHATWHVPGTEQPVRELGRDPLPGDLFQANVRYADGRAALVRFVVDAR